MLRLFNSLSKEVEEFKPINPPAVSVYTCGPTVYQFAHIGNLRSFSTADILVRALALENYNVNFVMNITDVGHLTNDDAGGADTGEDKIEKTALKEGKTASEVSKFYTDAFLRDYNALNMTLPAHLPKATDHISEQIQLIEKLQKKGYTYLTNEGLYFDTSKFKKYGQLSSLDKIKAGARVEFNGEKKNPRDFALWKFSPVTDLDSRRRQMEWDSPWGIGFPGWHIECSAMSMKYLGPHIDIHTGGVDHKEIHHPNEIAQSEAATGKKFVNYWLHTAFMLVAGQKMSKSLNNIYTLYDLEKEGFEPMALRYLFLQTHYRQEMNFTFGSLTAASKAYKKLLTELVSLGNPEGEVAEFSHKFFAAVNDDLNMPKALSVLWELLKSDYPNSAKLATVLKMDSVLGLDLERGTARISSEKQIVPPQVRQLLKERKRLRGERRFNEADRVRKQINDLGFEIEDNDKGTTVRKK